jgi:hypothetical protein
MNRDRVRYSLLPLAAVLAFVLGGMFGERVAIALGFWTYPLTGFCAAFAVVSVVYLVAPDRKFYSSCISYVIGAVLAFLALKDCYDPRTYEPTLMPFWVTLAGGAFALAIAAAHTFGGARSPSNTSLDRTREK